VEESFLSWPFFDDAHRTFARELAAWCHAEIAPLEDQEDGGLDGTCREIVRRLGAGGWLRHAGASMKGPARSRSWSLRGSSWQGR